MSKLSCKVCNKNINKNHTVIKCANKACDQWVHIKCNLMNKKEFEHLKLRNDPFFCIICLEDNIPFTKLSDNEFYFAIIKGINTQLCDDNIKVQFFSEHQKKYIKNINDLLKRTTCDSVDDDNTTTINCNYFDVSEFAESKFNSNKSFSVFHINIHSIQLHFEELKLMLQLLNFKFDVLAITETKIEKGIDPIIDICLDGYHKPV